jgi:predicted nuclease with TOPRIM domain
MNMKHQIQEMQEQNTALLKRLEQIEKASEEQRATIAVLDTLTAKLSAKQLAQIAELVAQKLRAQV